MRILVYICFHTPFFFFKMKLRSKQIDENKRVTRSKARTQEKGKSTVKKSTRKAQKQKTQKPQISSIQNSCSSTSRNFPNTENPLDFFASTILDFEGISYKSQPMELFDQEDSMCEEKLMADILLQISTDTSECPGLQSGKEKALGPDLNLPVEDEEEATGDNCVAGEFNEPTIAAGEPRLTLNFNPRPLGDASAVDFIPSIATTSSPVEPTTVAAGKLTPCLIPAAGDTSLAGKIEQPPCSLNIDALKVYNPNPLLDLSHVPATGHSVAVQPSLSVAGDTSLAEKIKPPPCPVAIDALKINNPSLALNSIDEQSPVFCSEAPSQVFSHEQLNNMKVLLQNSVNRIGGMGTFAGTGNTHVQDHTIGSNLRPSVENYVHFGQLSSFSASSQSLRPFEPQHKVWNHSFRNNQLGPISTPSHSLDRSERVEFDLVKMFAQAKEQIHDPTPLTTVFPLGLKPKDDLLGVHKRQQTEPKSGPVLKPTWKPVRGKHVESGWSSCIRGTKGKELEEGEIRKEVHSFKGFNSKLAFEQYRTFCNKNGHTPKGFNEHTLHDFPQIQSTIRGLKWDILCTVPKPYNLTWVREFFAEVSCICSFEVTVRNTKVDFSAKAINKVLNLTPPGFSKLDQLEKQASQTDLDHILEIVARPGAEWSFRGTSRVLLTQFLKPIANVWYYFVRNTLHPSNHDPDLCLIRVFLIYCIMTQQPLDVGKHIARQIKLSVSRASTKLPYPAIIHMLMAASRVPIVQTDQFSRDKMVMDRQNIDRLIRNKEVVNTDYPPNDIHSLGRFVYKNHVDFTAMMKEHVRNSGRTIKLLEELRGEMKEVKERDLYKVKAVIVGTANFGDQRQWMAEKQYWTMVAD